MKRFRMEEKADRRQAIRNEAIPASRCANGKERYENNYLRMHSDRLPLHGRSDIAGAKRNLATFLGRGDRAARSRGITCARLPPSRTRSPSHSVEAARAAGRRESLRRLSPR